ncbi:hypothetical protein KCTC32516_00261 [Polaribacter huanghezhanensis]|uniref:hypothetical protein n=1 Tax=Polaribacter huanghezhanensis TaxID=1354726 RepID=UPI002649B415|nr:hypothetical protein [Polaribacter huanghezhanensis]WKD84925.1 hypothetical protein KCTC32516_00261 [Polaribacter huanghezhanensis]
MAKNRDLIKNTNFNFSLKGRPSIFIGIYILMGALLIKTTIEGFSTDGSPFGFLTVNFLEGFIVIITVLVVLFSMLALFFGNRKFQRKIGNKIWNRNSKKSMILLIGLLTLLYFIEFYFLRIGEEQFLIPAFLIGFGGVLMILNFSKSTTLYYLSMISVSLGIIALYTNGMNFYLLMSLGVAQIFYGFFTRKAVQ